MSGLPQDEADERQPTNNGTPKLGPQPDCLARDATRRALPALARRLFGRVDAAAVFNISEDVLRHMRAQRREASAPTHS